MRQVTAILGFFWLLGCSNASGGGGGAVGADTKGCDAKTASGCIGFDVGSAKGSDGQGVDGGDDGSGAIDDAAVPDDGPTGADAAGVDDAADLGGFFDDPDATAAGDGPGGDLGTFSGDCPERAKIVYVVTEQNVLLSFVPDKLKFTVIGTLKCPSNGGTPFSMSVDRNANAWVLYQTGGLMPKGGGIYQVSTLDASCKTTAFKPASGGVELFGMGFSADLPGSPNETLFVAGAGASTFQTVKNTLATIAFPSMALQKVATIDIAGGADLTGNGEGELFGFFPDASPPSVRQIDKSSAGTSQKVWPLPTSAFNNTQAWAFAQWGGNFYLFFKSVTDASSNVWKLDPGTGSATKVMTSVGYTITGAGGSSCAPTANP